MKSFSSTAPEQKKYYKYAFFLAVLTVCISLGEAFFSIYFGLKGESLTLFGFGMDSFIEILSGIGVAHMILRITSNPETNRDAFEKTALRITGLSFYLLVAGLVATVTYNLYLGHKPETTISGIMISLASMILMIALVWGKTRTGKKLQSKAILSDAECTRVCIYMSLILLVSSGIYELTRMPFIDELGTLALAWLSFHEGRECFEKAKHEVHCSCGHD